MPCGRTSGSATSGATASAPATSAPAALASSTLESRGARTAGRWAANTFVASVVPRLARVAITNPVTVTKATAPRSAGASPRASRNTETK